MKYIYFFWDYKLVWDSLITMLYSYTLKKSGGIQFNLQGQADGTSGLCGWKYGRFYFDNEQFSGSKIENSVPGVFTQNPHPWIIKKTKKKTKKKMLMALKDRTEYSIQYLGMIQFLLS